MIERRALSLADRLEVADAVVVGTGVAGLSTALGLGRRRITVLTKTRFGRGSSEWAQGGVAVAMADGDSASEHAADTLAAGAGLCDEGIVSSLTGEGPQRIANLLALGAAFDRDPAGQLTFGREAAHGRRRILHARDRTGAEIVRALTEAVRREPRIAVHEDAFVHDLVLEDGRVVGVLARHHDGETILHRAPAVVLATGGFGRLYSHTTNPLEATGDGLALAARAGAVLADLEMVQFHPTALAAGGDPLPLVTEALRGEGAVLKDDRGERFMLREHPLAELAPRDVVARAIASRRAAGRDVFLEPPQDVRRHFAERFPRVFELSMAAGIDPRCELLPVTPAAHYAMAGIAVDGQGRSSLPGLWACGEVTSSGMHGANRLASNSLLEALILGARVAEDIAGRDLPGPSRAAGAYVRHEPSGSGEAAPLDALRRLMWERSGLVRDGAGLSAALGNLSRWSAALAGEVSERSHLVTVGRLVTAAALAREESRGAHHRLDFPHTRSGWRHRLFWTYEPRLGEAFPLHPSGTFAAPIPAVREIA